MKHLIYLLLLLLTIGKASSQSNIKIGEKAPDINITHWILNEPADKNLSDKYIVLEFWATWCGPCIAAVPHMNKLQETFKGKNIYYISITDESVEKVQRSLKRINFNSIIVTDLTKATQINYGDGEKGLEQYPLTVLIDNKNTIQWIGEPKDLDNKIMAGFLKSKGSDKKAVEKEKNEITKTTNQPINFIDLIKNQDIEHYFSLTESESNASSKQTVGTKILSLTSYTLKGIYSSILNLNRMQVEVPDKYKNKHYDLLYKNSDTSNAVEQLEKEILNELKLSKQVESKKQTVNIITVKDKSLLEETLEKRFSAKSGAGDRIIFTAFTIDDMLEELSKRSPESFEFQDKSAVKYDFIIRIDSKEEMIKSLASYGLRITEKEKNVDYIKLVSKK